LWLTGVDHFELAPPEKNKALKDQGLIGNLVETRRIERSPPRIA
jgi:hypothetical protein